MLPGSSSRTGSQWLWQRSTSSGAGTSLRRIETHGTDQHGWSPVQLPVAQRATAQSSSASQRGMRTGREDAIHPGARVRRPTTVESHDAVTGLDREFLSLQRSQVRAPEHDIPPGEEGVEARDAEVTCHRLERLDRQQSHGGVHVRRLPEEPIADDAFADHYLDLLGIHCGNVAEGVPGTAEIRVLG